MTKNGGYSIVNLASSTLYADLQKVSALEKPILVYGDDQPYYADELTTDGSSFNITKGGQIINVASDGTITKTGDKDGALLSSIVDDKGNARHQKFDISFDTTTFGDIFNGLVMLNGNVLTIVGAIDRTYISTSIGTSVTFGTITIPEWIGKKIYTWREGSTFVREFNVCVFSKDLTLTISLRKLNNTTLQITNDNTSVAITQLANDPSISFEINVIIE